MPSTTVNCPIPARISPGLSAFFMAVGSVQIPYLACRAAASAAASAAAQSLSVTSAETSASPRRSSSPCTGVSEPCDEDKGRLAAVAVRRVVFAVQRHVAAADDGRQRRPAAGLVCSGRARCRRGGPRGRHRGESCARRSRRRRGLRPAARRRNRRSPVRRRWTARDMPQQWPGDAMPDRSLRGYSSPCPCPFPDARRHNTTRDCHAGGDDGNQRHRTYFPHRLELRALPRILSQAAAVSRA